MEKKNQGQVGRRFELTALLTIAALFVVVLAASWIYALNLRQSILSNSEATQNQAQALIEVEKVRNLVDSQIDNSRAFFLLGSSSLMDALKKERESLRTALTDFEKKYSLPQIPEIIKRMEALDLQNQDFFDQGMKFREKNTESKIVGQFYQSKIKPIRTGLHEALDQIAGLEKTAIENAGEQTRAAARSAEIRIPAGMMAQTISLAALFFGISLLVMRLLRQRAKQAADHGRLFEEAKLALQARDEVIHSVSQDLQEPLNEIANTPAENHEDLKNKVAAVEGTIKDITDQARSGAGTMIMRLDQLGINNVLDDARHLLQPLAKRHDIRLQIDSTNPPILAFFDRERVVRVLANLVGNAIKFSPKHSRVTVKVRGDQQLVYISVEDSAPALPADQVAGVRMAVAKTIVEAHGGTLSVQSQGSSGNVFTFTLPRRRPVGAFLAKPSSNIKYVLRSEPQLDI